jgi:hypothetical protein
MTDNPWADEQVELVSSFKEQGWQSRIDWNHGYCATDQFDDSGNKIASGYSLHGEAFYQTMNECPEWFNENDWLILQLDYYCN